MPSDPNLALTIFRRVVLLDADARNEQLRAACGDNANLRREIDELLHHHDKASRFDTDAMSGWSGLDATDQVPTLAGYHDLQRIGAGGMGVVYRATQQHPRRNVALKMLRLDAHSEELRARFQQETHFLAQLQHPGIAQVFDAGTLATEFGDLPFYTMELLDGLPIDEHCQRHALNVRARCELVAAVCDAIVHAHERGIVHRDLKPSNVLVCPTDGGNFQPKILDFGIARGQNSDDATGTALLTRTGQVLGTLAYMSPEQAANDPVDHRTDVYTVGVILYELLAGRLPLDPSNLSMREMQVALENTEPALLSQLVPTLHGDLDVITAKALAKEPARRYASAAELAADLRRHLEHQPIHARPMSAFYFLRKSIRRHRALVAGAMTTLLAMLIGSIATLIFAAKETEARVRAENNAEVARRNEAKSIATLQRAVGVLVDAGQHWDALEQLQQIPERARGWSWRLLAASLPRMLPAAPDTDIDDGHWYFLDETKMVKNARNAALSQQRTLVRSITGDSRPRPFLFDQGVRSMWFGRPSGFGMARTESENLVVDWRRETVVRHLPRSEQDRGRAVLANDQVFATCPQRGQVSLYVDGQPTHSFAVGDEGYCEIAPDGVLATIRLSDRRWQVLDVRSGRILLDRTTSADEPFLIRPGNGCVVIYHKHRNGRNKLLQRLDLVDGELVSKTPRIDDVKSSMIRISQDGTLLAEPIYSQVRLRDMRTGEPAIRSRLQNPEGVLRQPGQGGWVEISPSAELLALTFRARPVYLIELDPRAADPDFDPRCITLRGHTEWIYHMAVSHDGRHVVSSAPRDKFVRVWDASSGEQIAEFERRESWDALLAFSADDQRIVFTGNLEGSESAVVIDWQWQTGAFVATRPETPVETSNHAPLLDLFLDVLQPGPRERLGHKAAMAGGEALSIWREEGHYKQARTMERGRRWRRPAPATVKGRRFAALSVHPHRPEVAIVHDSRLPGSTIRTTTNAGVVVRNLESGEQVAHVAFEQRSLMCADYSPDGSLLAVGTRTGQILILDTEHWVVQLQLRAHRSYIYSIAWMPDGQRLVTASGDKTLRIWDPRLTGR